MGIAGAIAVYFVLWWLAFIAVLPFGVRTLEETGDVELGQTPSAPSRPLLLRKVAAASVIAAMVWIIFYVLIEYAGLTIDLFTFFDPPTTAGK